MVEKCFERKNKIQEVQNKFKKNPECQEINLEVKTGRKFWKSLTSRENFLNTRDNSGNK